MKTTISFAFILFAGLNSAAAQDLVDVAGDSREIRTFLQVVQTAEMGDVLKEGGPYTVFAPSNSAFLSLSGEERDRLMSDKMTARRAVSDHVVPGKLVVSEIKPGKTETIDGSEISLKSDNGLVKVENASVILSDIAADNGVIHVVDALVKPSR